MAAKKITIPKQLFAVAWVSWQTVLPPEATECEVISLGGRIIDKNLSEKGALEVERCLNIGTPLDGLYMSIQQV